MPSFSAVTELCRGPVSGSSVTESKQALILLLLFVFIYMQQIDGKAFLLLTQTDIVKVMKIKLGPALKIYNSILMFRNSQDLTEEGPVSGQEARG